MTKILSLINLLFFLFSNLSFAQTPALKWAKRLTSVASTSEIVYDVQSTRDKNFVVVGADSSGTTFLGPEFVTKSLAGRAWITKTDTEGNRIWKNTIANATNSSFFSVAADADGGFVAVGFYTSVSQAGQALIVKYDKDGNRMWQKTFGGDNEDRLYSIVKTKTKGFIAVGVTASVNGDITGNHGVAGTNDVWLVRFDDEGNILWSKCFGGAQSDIGYAVVQSSDFGFVVGGKSNSTDGNLTENNGSGDGWLLKTDSTGMLLWQKSMGGTADDGFNKVVISSDNSIYVSGSCNPTASGIINGSLASNNVFVARFTPMGAPVWGKAFGGTSYDVGFDIDLNFNSSLVVTGFTMSKDQDAVGNPSTTSVWVFAASFDGNLIWQKSIGSTITGTVFGAASVCIDENDFFVTGTTSGSTKGAADGYVAQIGNANTIKGTLYVDVNTNAIYDPGESMFSNAAVHIQKNGTTADAIPYNGNFIVTTDTGTYSTSVVLNNPYYIVTPSSRTSSFSNYLNVDSFGFAVQPISGKQDITISFIPTGPARPGFKSYYVLNYKNIGTTTISSGSVKLVKDPRVILTGSTQVPSQIKTDTIIWNYTNLSPLSVVTIGLEMQNPAPPVLTNLDTLKFSAVILPIAGDLTPADDTTFFRQKIVGSYDPNDKQENFAGRILIREVSSGAYINYVIRFQNTGNDTAFTVRVMDTLTNKLDWNSFQMIGASHPYTLSVKDGNKIEWVFNNINLPDSSKNQLFSNGFIAFRIKASNTAVINDVIINSSSIYFDYNQPVVTNSTNTIVGTEITTGLRDIQSGEMQLILGPNPSNGTTRLQISGTKTGRFDLRIFDNSGRVIWQKIVERRNEGELLNIPINMNQFSFGIYYIQLQQKDSSWWQKLILQ